MIDILDVLEADRRYVNLAPKGEPQLGRRGLYPTIGGAAAEEEQLAMLWVLNQSDGRHSLLDVAERSGSRSSRSATPLGGSEARDCWRSPSR